MITPSFALTATERVLPKLALDFTTASLDSRITFTRTTGALNPATFVNSSGYITVATNNQPRFDYDPVTLVCKGLLIEESRTNSLLASNDITNATYWNQSGAVPVANQTTSPDGTANADLLREDATNGRHDNYNGTTLTAASYTYSQYVKPAGRTWVKLRLDVAGSFKGAYFDIANGTIGTVDSGYTATISNAGNGWYRCSVTTTATAATWFSGIRLATSNGVDSYQGDNTSGVYTGGSQTEAGAFATSYIPTTTAALTRNADVATMTGTNFSDWFNASEGTFVGQALLGASTQLPAIATVRNTTADAITFGFQGASQTTCQIWVGGVNQVSLGPARNYNAVNKVAFAYKVDDVIASNNGNATASDNTALIPTVNAMYIGQNRVTSTSTIHIQKILYYPQRLTNNEVLTFSKV